MDLGVLLLLATLAAAPPHPAPRVSEQSFLDEAMADGRVRAVLDEPLAVARATRARAGVFANPEASFDREALNDQPRQDIWGLSWTPPLDGRPWALDRAARAGLGAAESRHEQSRIALRAEMRQAFAGWVLARDGAALGQRLAELVDGLARRAEAQASRGETSALTARRLLLARIEIRAEAVRLGADLAHAQGRVRSWAPGLSPGAVPTRPTLPPTPSDTSLWSRSPRLVALGHETRQAEALVGLASRFWSLPEFNVGRQSVRGNLVDLEGTVFGVRWGLPLFDRQRGDRIEAQGRLAAARGRAELERARVREEFAASLAAYVALREVASLTAEAETAAERVLSSASAMFQAGESDVTDLLETLRGVLGGQRAALDAFGAALRAHRELEIAAGRPLPLIVGGD